MLFKGFFGLQLQFKQLDFLQIFTRDIVYYTEFLRGFTVAHVELFSSGMVAVQMLASGFEDVEKGRHRRIHAQGCTSVYYGGPPDRTV